MSNRRRKNCRRAERVRNYHDFSEAMQEDNSVMQEENAVGERIRSAVANNFVDNASDPIVEQDADQVSIIEQESDELIWIVDSCDVVVETTDTQAAVSLQVGLQLAIALVISITIGSSDRGQALAQEIFQEFDSEQTNKQKIYIENSKDVNITTSDTDLTVNIQAMLQVLLALVVSLDLG